MISRDHGKKAPSQNPVDFYKSQQQGGSQGKPGSVPERLTGGPMRELIDGRKDLAKS